MTKSDKLSLSSGKFEGLEKPFDFFGRWFSEARASEPNDPGAMVVSSLDRDGLPNSRVVLLRAFDERGFVFYTNFESKKGEELLASGVAALCLHWKSLRRQVRARGIVEEVTKEEADAYFSGRPRGSQIGAWASDQSRPLDSRAALEQRVNDVEERFHNSETVERPPHWSGFRIIPSEIEFWADGEFRLHDRFRLTRQDDGTWSSQRLFP